MEVLLTTSVDSRAPWPARIARILGLLMIVLAIPSLAAGQGEGTSGGGNTALENKPSLGLDSLLRPRGLTAPTQDVAGHDEEHWRTRFSSARAEISELEVRISETLDEIKGAVNPELQYTPTGGGAPSDPEVLRLQAALKRDRGSLETAERRLRELEVEASLAGVPGAWAKP